MQLCRRYIYKEKGAAVRNHPPIHSIGTASANSAKFRGIKPIRENPPQFENPIMARVYVRSIMRSTMYQEAPFCSPEMAL